MLKALMQFPAYMFNLFKRFPIPLKMLWLFSVPFYPVIGIVLYKAFKQFLPQPIFKFVSLYVMRPAAVVLPVAAIGMVGMAVVAHTMLNILAFAHTLGAGLGALFYYWYYLDEEGLAARKALPATAK